MIPIVEDYLNDLIEQKFTYLKSNPGYIDKILKTSQVRLDRLKDFIQSKPIRIVKGYPIDPAQLPCICILLSGEEESQDSLGDYGDDDLDTAISEYTETVEVIARRGADYPFPYIKLSNSPVVGISQIVNLELGGILDPMDYSIEDEDLGIASCDGAEDGDTLTVTYTYKRSVTEQSEVLYESNYRLEVWAKNGDLTVELYHVLKWMLISGRSSLISDVDLFRQKLSGADFEPAPNFFPDFVYRRALNFWCQFMVSTPDEESEFINGIQVNQSDYTEEFIGGDS